ncbi:Response regulator containing a CheY-like receiver domain and an HTH DNA-binding domain protein [Legionella quinlivanii]|uniref:Response regulator containing a CheY-like receiver domain and an HTH DNA-binding domain protein n=1 Tax=Legionella quinlivanii TaxID=45073 RepID=A0A0W0XNA2_9GAMM|nr:helix-turn-helix transcriptional regulator [Legionella quinlivanii]KTD46119.1 Response regulator containing a CheY-like receiver domain and an HTH DNA-binding domain protein [Legionella quinlivanii]MCW8451191.1 LuxR C-terminal-related transcriptional regulator [Legionella quinlivanii]SEG28211.1 regulatory protein, luxR family [Legionella quinlivanii DSM 21216]STY10616.1 Response regulator containing a CheY-like receiver domain and an HTH DNA-binding domain [Legionella quinlivanii]
MNSMIEQLKKHPIVLQSEKIQALCKPLRHLNISTFSHIRNYNENDFSLLCNQPDFVQNYAKKEYYKGDPCVQIKSESIDFGQYIVWDMLDCKGITAAMLQDSAHYNFRHVFTLVKQSAEYSDYFHFGTDLSNIAIHQTYINNLDLLERFTQYFEEKVSEDEDLCSAYSQRFSFEKNSTEVGKLPESHRASFLQSISGADKVPLSLREIECAQLLVCGKTTKEIAFAMNLSPRTIDDKIEALKSKYRVRNKNELIIKLLDN